MAAAAAAVAAVGGAAAIASGAGGTVTTVAGESGTAAFAGDGGPAAAATFSSPQFLTRAPDGALLVDDWVDHVVRRIDPVTNVVTTIAGTPGVASSSPTARNGDGGPATAATLNRPSGLAFLADGTLLIADANNHRIRGVDPATGVIRTVAGSGTRGSATQTNGDGGQATSAKLNQPFDVAVLPGGRDLLIADSGDNRLRRVDAATGRITTVAGTGATGERDHADPLQATFSFPQGLSSADGVTWFVADRTGPTVRRFGPSGVATVAGQAGRSGTPTAVGDGGPATSATLDLPLVVSALADGGFLVADAEHFRIRRVLPGGTIATVVGTGVAGYDGPGAPVASARIGEPVGVLPGADGSITFVDWWNPGSSARMRVRRASGVLPVDAAPAVTPASGTGETSARVPAATLAPSGATPAPIVLPAPAAPRAGESVGVERSGSGRVRIKLPGTTTYVPLAAAATVPVGAMVDARHGAVALTSARTKGGPAQTAVFSGGRFMVRQRRATRYVTELHLRGGSFAGCPAPPASPAVAAAAAAKRSRKHVVRRLWGSDRGGRFRTHGRNSVATVRGTKWLTVDRCDGTLTRVVSGAVAVRDHGRTVIVRAGHAHLAKARPR